MGDSLEMASMGFPLALQSMRLNKASFRALAYVRLAQKAINLIVTAYDYAASAEHREGFTALIDKRLHAFRP